ncbi:hypothetical protein AKJ16_DCAP14832 [Drosera capensis]
MSICDEFWFGSDSRGGDRYHLLVVFQAVKSLAKSPTFSRGPRHLQFEADINRPFLYTSYKLLGREATEADAEEIIDIASKASLADQQKQVQENIHSQIKVFTIPKTKPLRLPEVSHSPKEQLGYSLTIQSSQIPHKDAGRGLFLKGEADVGSVIAVYPVSYIPQHITITFLATQESMLKTVLDNKVRWYSDKCPAMGHQERHS